VIILQAVLFSRHHPNIRQKGSGDSMEKKQNDPRRTIRNLIIFTMIVLGIGWVGRWLDVQMGSPPTESLGMLIWLVVPSLAALLLRAFAGDGWKDFGLRPNFKGNSGPYLVAFLVYPVLTLIVLLIGRALGLISFPNFTMGSLGVILQVFLAGVIPQFIKNIFEETAWRGYLAPKVYSLGLDNLAGHTIVGLIWGAWHIPYYLFYLDRAVLEQFSTLNVAVFIPVSIVVMIAWAVVYGELRLMTNSIWPAVFMHMVEDAFLNQLFIDGHVRIVPGTDWLVSPVNGVISILLFLAVGLGLRRWRLSRRQAA
jgi:hypothetical protein